jgi:hypothetical protein
MQHLFITTTWRFLRLAKVLSRPANHAKNAALEGDWVCHTLFQGKQVPSKQAKEKKKDLTLNRPFSKEIHQSLFSLPLLTSIKCDT